MQNGHARPRYLIIGAGASGIIALHELLRSENYLADDLPNVVLFERRAEIGGVWLYSEDVFPSPAYENLMGNVLPKLCQFGQFPIPKPAHGPFPTLKETHDWLCDVARPYRQYMQFNTQVVELTPADHGRWTVKYRDWSSTGAGAESTEIFDRVIVAAGPFDTPWAPTIEGLQALLDSKSDLVMHSKFYRGPSKFAGQHNKVVVVGNANSGNDIAAHLMNMNDGPVYRCIRAESRFATVATSKIEDVPPVASVKQAGDTLTITLEGGRILSGITKLILATGYAYNFDWIKVYNAQGDLVPASRFGAVPNLYASIFCQTNPNLAFSGLNINSTPIPLAEIQARVIACVWSGRLTLPENLVNCKDIFTHDVAVEDVSGGWRSIHAMRGPPERRLLQSLLDWLERDFPGSSQALFRWDNERETIAKGMRAIKEADLQRMLQF